jgi:hypothetical protein
VNRILAIAVLATVAIAGLAAGHHLSVGASQARVEVSERPGDPSVDRELYHRGVETDCPTPRLDPADPSRGKQDPMCGRLVYHEGTEFERWAPADQVVYDPVAIFDAQRTHTLGVAALTTCQPWCLQPSVTYPLYDSVNNLAYRAGLAHSDRADEADHGTQSYGGGLQRSHALTIAQEQAGLGEGNGWTIVSHDRSFVAILEDGEGYPVGPHRLREIAADRNLPAAAEPTVCGFSPDIDLGHDGCELPFRWETEDTNRGDNPCRSPTYVCAPGEGSWQARLACAPAHGCGSQASTLTGSDRLEKDQAHDLDPRPQGTRPVVWHFVAAPSVSECGGHREPGFDPSPDASSLGFLGHDLDVYTTLDTRHDVHVTPLVRHETAAGTAKVADLVHEATDPVWREPAPEPNQPGELGGLRDTSASHPIDRDWRHCLTVASPETRDTLDPWADVVDARLVPADTNAHVEGTLEAPAGTEGQRARTGTYVPTGRTVYAADTDDDGDRETAAWGDWWTTDGVYPVLWDMHATPEGWPDPEAGCRLHDSGIIREGQTLTEAMLAAGYEAGTGLVQALALDEPVVWTHRPTGTEVPFPEGGVFVLGSQAVHELGLGPSPQAPMAEHVRTVTNAAAEAAGLADRDPIVLRQALDVDPDGQTGSDWQPQCGEPAGGFTSRWSLTRACTGQGECTTSTAVTRLLFEISDPEDAFFDHATWARPFPDDHTDAFPRGQHNWTDVDRLGPVSR